MGRMVIAPLDSETVTSDATQDLWSLMAASTNKIILHGWEVSSDAECADRGTTRPRSRTARRARPTRCDRHGSSQGG